ncbi:Isochorismatase hydrolase [Ceratobasidium sp. AG-I]|nr:Isochorismatase hydrolase [Ceratobasidium sp. AG-I]
MSVRPNVPARTTYGTSDSYWVEYPDGLVDLSRQGQGKKQEGGKLVEFDVQGERRVRIDPGITALVVVDMQNYFLHPELRDHPSGLACVDPLVKILPRLREAGVLIIWLNWGLEEFEIPTIAAPLSRCFSKPKLGRHVDPPGLGADLGGKYGRILLRGEWNAELYGPLKEEWERSEGKDLWVHKNRMSGFGGGSTSDLERFLEERGLKTLLFAGVNADQCVIGTVAEAFSKGYDIVVVEDLVATTSPEGGKSNLVFNALHCYGFVTSSTDLAGMSKVKGEQDKLQAP